MDDVEEMLASNHEYLTFRIGKDEFAVPLLRVREVVAYDEPTRVPGVPDCFRGVINLRGQVVPIVDIAAKLSTTMAPISRRTCLVIIDVAWDGESTLLGVIVDEMVDVVDLHPGEIETVPSLGTRIRLDFLQGVGKCQSRLVLVLAIDKVLSAVELLAASDLSSSEAVSADVSP